VEGEPSRPWAQLLVYGFGPGAEFEGRLVGALERIETGGALRILDALFVQKDASTGEIAATSFRGSGTGGIVGQLLGFRLDPTERRRVTQRALGSGDSRTAETLQQLAEALPPGAAVAAVLVEHAWGRALEEAVSRSGGAMLAGGYVEATALSEVASDLLTAARNLRSDLS
jgi:transcription termination factor Rho